MRTGRIVLKARVARPLIAARSPWLRGRVRLPGDQFAGSVVLVVAAMARGESVIEHLPDTTGTHRLIGALRQLGAVCDRHGERWHVQGLGAAGFLQPVAPLPLRGSNEDALLIGLVGLMDMKVEFSGAVANPELDPLLGALRGLGTKVEIDGGRLVLEGPRFPASPDLSLTGGGLMKAGLLLASVAVPGVSRIVAPIGPGHVERQLRGFGARVDREVSDLTETISVAGLPQLRAQAISLPSDPGLAAIPAIAALVCPHSDVTIEAVLTDPSRTGLLAVLMEMGGNIDVLNPRRLGGEDAADLVVRHSVLHGIEINAESGIDPADWPLLAVAAAFAEGDSLLRHEGEPQKLFPLLRALQAAKVSAEITNQGLLIHGIGFVAGGGKVVTRLDPRLAIAFLLMGTAAAAPIEVDDSGMFEDFFPGFVPLMEGLGASLSEPAK